MNPQTLYFWLTTLVLAGLLFFPVSQVIFVLSVRRLQRLKHEPLDAAELRGQRLRARFIAVLLVLPFAWLFNGYLLRLPQ
ncbi:MAG: hypothetical protein ACFCBW_06185 [Candidatus Competibacterales bacterium]